MKNPSRLAHLKSYRKLLQHDSGTHLAKFDSIHHQFINTIYTEYYIANTIQENICNRILYGDIKSQC